MKAKFIATTAFIHLLTLALPVPSHAQGLAEEIGGLHGILDDLFEDMMTKCEQLIGVSSGIGGFATLFYIAARVWRNLSTAEPIDFYPLFRPFAIGFCLIKFPLILALINGVMKPTVAGTAAMVEGSNNAVSALLEQKEKKLRETDMWQMYVGEDNKGDRDHWYRYTYDNKDPQEEGIFGAIGNDIRFAMEKAGYGIRNSMKEWMSAVLQVLFQAAALCINTLRTFQLIVLAILGPLVFALSIFDGFQHTLTIWLARYINIFLWLPVSNIFGSIIGRIQEKMVELDLQQISETGYTTVFNATDAAYLIFMVIGIVGYFTVPTVANYIVNAAGGGALQQKVTSMFNTTTAAATGGVIALGGAALSKTAEAASMSADMIGDQAGRMSSDMADHGQVSGYFKDKLDGND